MSVRQRGQTDTFVHTACCWCDKPLIGNAAAAAVSGKGVGYWYCDSCKRRQDGCVICRKGVKGRWVMCQGCGHGGHDECLRDWYFGSVLLSTSAGAAAAAAEADAGDGGGGAQCSGREGSIEEEEEEVEDDDEPMEMCPAVGCAHECLPR